MRSSFILFWLFSTVLLILSANSVAAQENCTAAPPPGFQIPPVTIVEPWYFGDAVGGPSRCVPLSNFTDAELGLCKPYIEPFYNDIYVDVLTPARIQIAAAASVFVSGTDPVCGVVALRHMCPTFFPRCDETLVPGTNDTVVLRTYNCRSLCEDTALACYQVFKDQLQQTDCETNAVLSCFPVGAWVFFSNTTRDIFPRPANGTTDVTIQDIASPLDPFNPAEFWDYPTQCFNDTRFYTAGAIPFDCPDGFTPSGSFCSYECPYPFIEDDEYTALSAVAGCLGFISGGFCILLMLFWLFIPGVTLAREAIYMTLCAIGISFALFMNILVGRDEMWCDDDHRPNLWGHPGCTIQGILLVYCTSAAILWWLALIIVLCLIIVLRTVSHKKRLKKLFGRRKFTNAKQLYSLWELRICSLGKFRPWIKYVKVWLQSCIEKTEFEPPAKEEWKIAIRWVSILEHLVCWGLPAIQLVIALSAQRLGYSGSNAWCGIHANTEVTFSRSGSGGVEKDGGSNPDWWNLFLFTIPLLIVVLLGAFLGMCLVVYCTILVFRAALSHERSAKEDSVEYKESGMSSDSIAPTTTIVDSDNENGCCVKCCMPCKGCRTGISKICAPLRNCWNRVVQIPALQAAKTAGSEMLVRQWKVVVYPLILILPFMFMFVFRLVFEIQKPIAQDEQAKSISCTFLKTTALYVTAPGTVGNIEDLCAPDIVISFPLWMTFVILFSSWPISLFFMFGCVKPVWTFVKALALRCVGKAGDLEIDEKLSRSSGYYRDDSRFSLDARDASTGPDSTTETYEEEVYPNSARNQYDNGAIHVADDPTDASLSDSCLDSDSGNES